MSSLLPLASYNLELDPYSPQPAQTDDFPVTIRLTLAAIDPEAVDDENTPSTLRILKASAFDDEFDDDLSEDDEDSEDDEESEEGEESEEEEEKESKKEKSEDAEDSEEDSDEEDFDDDDVEEHVICTLSPTTQFQQTIDLTILPDERVFFVVTGSYKVHLTGNYVEHPYDNEDDYSDEDSEEDDSDYDLTPDEDEIIDGEDFDLDELDDVEDVEGKIEELVEEDNNKKRAAEEEEEEKAEVEKPTKKAKKEKKEKAEKGVKFNKELEQGPTKKAEKEAPKAAEPKKFSTKTLAGGVVIEDRTTGTGPVAKKGQKVGVRYIGKLKNGKVFDKNTSGKPFNFGLGKGEVIKGWDVGVAGMAVGGERRIVIPAPMAYGSKKLPGIPANSELTFDVKLLSIK